VVDCTGIYIAFCSPLQAQSKLSNAGKQRLVFERCGYNRQMRAAPTNHAIGICILILLGFSHSMAQSNVVLGILEESPHDVAGETNSRDVRVVFKKVGNEWRPYPSNCQSEKCLKSAVVSYPQNITWTVAFDGRNLGQVTSQAPAGFRAYWRIGQQLITSQTPIPTVGKRSREFGGFLDAEVYRPLIVVSQPNFKDPAVWKPIPLTPDLLRAVRRQFRLKYPKMCRPTDDETKLLPFPYADEDLKLVKSYASTTGWKLAHVHLDATDCEDTEAGFGIDDPWFLIEDKGGVRYLGSGMFLVDIGDYDADGKAELMFAISGDNIGGYRIYYDEFRRSAEFKFHYH
jgi:hypothetical protein